MKPVINPVLQAKFLQHLNNKKKGNEGFTLIELLVVVIIIGVLAAIALPSLLSQVSKARQTEAKQNVGAMNRAQQAFFLENNNTFGTSVQNLALGIRTQTDNYIYDIGTATNVVVNQGRSLKQKLKSYGGTVYTSDQQVNSVTESITLAILCESVNPASTDNASGVPLTVFAAATCATDAGGGGVMKTIK